METEAVEENQVTAAEEPAPATSPVAAAPAPTAPERPRAPRSVDAGDDDDRPRRRGGRRRRVCVMCADHIKVVDYKNVGFLRRYISDRARIETRRRTSACAKHQRALSQAIKRARHLALLPYTAVHIRGMTTGHR